VLEQLGDNAKQPRFTRARERYAGAKNQGSPPAVSGLGKPHAPPEVWFDDLVEWEDAGSANARCAAIILDAEGVDDRTTRRCAVLGRLAALALDKADEATDFALEVLANHLAPIGLYQVLPALEVLSEHPASRVRIAALRALGRHSYKRSFLSLERAIDDQDQNVKDAAVEEIRRQRFDHAFQPLARIYGQSAYGPARLAALQALAHLELNEAHELLLAALEHGTPAEVDAATEALTRTQSQSFVHTARALLPNARPRLKQAIHKILRARGEAP
jgi:HEAT repeat protein